MLYFDFPKRRQRDAIQTDRWAEIKDLYYRILVFRKFYLIKIFLLSINILLYKDSFLIALGEVAPEMELFLKKNPPHFFADTLFQTLLQYEYIIQGVNADNFRHFRNQRPFYKNSIPNLLVSQNFKMDVCFLNMIICEMSAEIYWLLLYQKWKYAVWH